MELWKSTARNVRSAASKTNRILRSTKIRNAIIPTTVSTTLRQRNGGSWMRKAQRLEHMQNTLLEAIFIITPYQMRTPISQMNKSEQRSYLYDRMPIADKELLRRLFFQAYHATELPMSVFFEKYNLSSTTMRKIRDKSMKTFQRANIMKIIKVLDIRSVARILGLSTQEEERLGEDYYWYVQNQKEADKHMKKDRTNTVYKKKPLPTSFKDMTLDITKEKSSPQNSHLLTLMLDDLKQLRKRVRQLEEREEYVDQSRKNFSVWKLNVESDITHLYKTKKNKWFR